jgi:hypothetical protein
MALTREQGIDRLSKDINHVKSELWRMRADLANFGTPANYFEMARKGRLKTSVDMGLPLLLKRYQDTLNDPQSLVVYCQNN